MIERAEEWRTDAGENGAPVLVLARSTARAGGSELEPDLGLHRARRDVTGRYAEPRVAWPRPRVDQITVRVERQVGDRDRIVRARQVHRRVAPGDDRGVGRVEHLDTELDQP